MATKIAQDAMKASQIADKVVKFNVAEHGGNELRHASQAQESIRRLHQMYPGLKPEDRVYLVFDGKTVLTAAFLYELPVALERWWGPNARQIFVLQLPINANHRQLVKTVAQKEGLATHDPVIKNPTAKE